MTDKEGAIDALEIAHNIFRSGDMEKTNRLLNKCLRMYPTLNPYEHRYKCPQFALYQNLPDLIRSLPDLYKNYQKQQQQQQQQQRTFTSSSSSSSGSSSSSSSSGSSGSSSSSFNDRSEEPNSDAVEGVDYTKEQAEEVKKILVIEKDYYKVLQLERSCDEAAIKKSYRKVSQSISFASFVLCG